MARTNAPAPDIVGDVYRLVVNIQTASDNQQNTWDYMGNTKAADPAQNMPSILTALITKVTAQYPTVLTADSKVTYCQLACVSSGAPLTLLTTTNIVGTVEGSYLPIMTTAVVRRQSLLKGQHGRGRVEFPAVPASFSDVANDPSKLTNAALGLYITAAQQMAVAVAVGTFT